MRLQHTATETNTDAGQRIKSLPYIRNLFQDKFVGAITPSSSYVCRAVVRNIDFATAKTIVEFGAGEGALTKYLLREMRSDAKLIAFETNEGLATELEEEVFDKRLTVLHESAEKLKDLCSTRNLRPDVVVSGIPFSMFPEQLGRKSMKSTCDAIGAEGTFIVYQTWLPPFFKATQCRKLLAECFREVHVEDVYLNLPPLRIIAAKKR